jgi:hypothetical protein
MRKDKESTVSRPPLSGALRRLTLAPPHELPHELSSKHTEIFVNHVAYNTSEYQGYANHLTLLTEQHYGVSE